MAKGPVLIDLDETPKQKPRKKTATKVAVKPSEKTTPATAPDVVDQPEVTAKGQAMQTMAVLAARKPSIVWRWFWRLTAAVLAMVVSVAAWDFVTGLIARNEILGFAAIGVLGLFGFVCLILVIRELAALSRLRRVDKIQLAAQSVGQDIDAAKSVQRDVLRLYQGREDVTWGKNRLAQIMPDQFDAASILQATEREVLTPLDAVAVKEIEAGARQVALVTAIVPLAFADVIAALTANIRMVRRIAEIYGGRGGTIGSWRLMRTVLTHLVATGAVAVGDDLISSVAGGGALSKISRRFGEGIINAALTARVGVAAMEVCRPMPFDTSQKPAVTGLVRRAVTGLFDFKSAD